MNCPYCGQVIEREHSLPAKLSDDFPILARVLKITEYRFKNDPGVNIDMQNMIGKLIYVKGPLVASWIDCPYYICSEQYIWPYSWISIVTKAPNASICPRKIRPRKAPEDAHA